LQLSNAICHLVLSYATGYFIYSLLVLSLVLYFNFGLEYGHQKFCHSFLQKLSLRHSLFGSLKAPQNTMMKTLQTTRLRQLFLLKSFAFNNLSADSCLSKKLSLSTTRLRQLFLLKSFRFQNNSSATVVPSKKLACASLLQLVCGQLPF
jgi:hypothetical protein